MPWFGQELFEQAVKKGPLTGKAYLDALAKCRKLSRDQGLDAVFKEHQLDALLAPTGSPSWLIDYINGDHFVLGSSTPAAVAGYPAITVPAGYERGLPLGVTFIGKPWSEGALIKFAFAYEQATRHRKRPALRPTVELK
jgi:amidase